MIVRQTTPLTVVPTPHRGLVAQWTNAWATILNERRTGAARLVVAGAYAGAAAGAVFAPVTFLMVELFGRPSSTSVLGLFVVPFYMFGFGVAGAIAVGVMAALAGVAPSLRTAGANLRGAQAIRWAGWVGCVLGVLAAVANFYGETAAT